MERSLNNEVVTFPLEDEIDFRELFKALWAKKIVIIGATLIAAILGIAIALYIPNIYKAEALLAPAEESTGGGLAALAGQFGGLASLAGVDLKKNDVDKVTVGMAVLKSRAFIAEFISKRNILIPLMAAKRWDTQSRELILDDSIYDSSTSQWVRDVKLPHQPKPSELEAYEYFMEILDVGRSKETGLVSVSIRHQSPVLAKNWVNWIIEDVNNRLRTNDIDEAQRSVRYLEEEIRKTSISEMQKVFYQMVEKQTQTIMLANVRDQYVFKVIDPSVEPEEKASPKRVLIVFGVSVVGFIFAVLGVLINHSLKLGRQLI